MPNPLLIVDSLLKPETKLYRTLDFFSAAHVVERSQLMFSRADTFPDQNEGIDRLLAQLDAVHPNSGCGMGWSDYDSARRHHEAVKRSHFISCWSKNPESVAMWSLYSPDFCSVRIRTTAGKLSSVADKFLEKYCVSRFKDEDLGSSVVAAASGQVIEVKYHSLVDILRKVNRRAAARARLFQRHIRHGLEPLKIPEIGHRYWRREEARRFNELASTCLLKDKSFDHEQEVRVIIRLGETVCDATVLERAKHRDPAHEYYSIFPHYMSAWPSIGLDLVPNREFIDCPSDLVESVSLDPRCPPHKADFIRSWFSSRSIAVEESTSFGYLAKSFHVFPQR